jgi:putative protease
LEFFVHGSLCVSHSGQCYLSQYIGNRSANRGACAQPCRLPWDLLNAEGKVLVKGKHLLCLKDLNNSAHLEELMDAGITSFKIEGRLKEADYVKNITAYYRQQLDAIFERRPEFAQASLGHCTYSFEVNPSKSFNRDFTDYFIHGRQPNIGSPHTPKSMGEYIGEVKWCNSVQMEIATDKTLHNGDGLCFLNQDEELIGIRADVAKGNKVSCNRPHGAYRGAQIYRNYDIEWQRQVDASKGNRKIDIELTLEETEEGFELIGKLLEDRLVVQAPSLLPLSTSLSVQKIPATNPEKALENIRKKLSQWGDTIYNPINIDIRLSEPYLIPASVLGEMKRQLVTEMTNGLTEKHQNNRSRRDGVPTISTPRIVPDEIPNHLMTCHHCIRYANGLCPKITGKPTGPLFIRNGEHMFPLEFDCKNCLMYVKAPE